MTAIIARTAATRGTTIGIGEVIATIDRVVRAARGAI
jgi:hypothetical protein